VQDAPGSVALDQTKVKSFMQRRTAEQSMPLALAAGIIAALVGAAIWAVITDTTGYKIGLIAVAVGFVVGFAVRVLGKGIERPYQYVGAACALLGCVLGNYFGIVGSVAADRQIDFFTELSRIPVDTAIDVMRRSFQPMDLLFYAIAVYEGYRFSLKRITPAELAALQ
jgi:MFS family permease